MNFLNLLWYKRYFIFNKNILFQIDFNLFEFIINSSSNSYIKVFNEYLFNKIFQILNFFKTILLFN